MVDPMRPAEGSMPYRTPLRGRYLANDWRLRLLLSASDLLLAPLRRGPSPSVVLPRKVLLSINGHLGDAVIATAAIRRLGEALPDAEIGLALPSWSRAVVDGNPRLHHLHEVDHWYTNRSSASGWERWRGHRRSLRRAIAEIRGVGYDAAVDLYDYFPNAALLLWRAGIPIRIGFDVAGFSALYTHAVPWPPDARHSAQRQLMLLQTLVPTLDALSPPRAELPESPPPVVRRVRELLSTHGVRPGDYTVIHVGAGSPDKRWPQSEWRAVAEQLVAEGQTLVFTGRGPAEGKDIAATIEGLPRCVDLCDALDWSAFVEVIRLARHVLSVDTVAGHVAGAVGTPATTLWTSVSSPQHWRPLGPVTVLLGNEVRSSGGLQAESVGRPSARRVLDAREVLQSLHAGDAVTSLDHRSVPTLTSPAF